MITLLFVFISSIRYGMQHIIITLQFVTLSWYLLSEWSYHTSSYEFPIMGLLT